MVMLIHIIAVALLVTINSKDIGRSQKIILITLCFTEITYAISDGGSKIAVHVKSFHVGVFLWAFSVTSVTIMYILIMIILTIDRFLDIYLNIKYELLWSFKKTKIVLTTAFIICSFLFIPAHVSSLSDPHDVGRTLVRYIYPVCEIAFIIVASFSYFYITKQIYRHRKATKKLKKQLNVNNAATVFYSKLTNNRFKIFVPTLIIITFVVFTIIPNTIKLCSSLKIFKSKAILNIAYVMIPIGFISDAIIYVFNLKVVRLKLRKTLRLRNSVNNCTTDYTGQQNETFFLITDINKLF